MTDTSMKIALGGLQLTVLGAFLAAYGGTQLALPSFGLAAVGTLVTIYGLADT